MSIGCVLPNFLTIIIVGSICLTGLGVGERGKRKGGLDEKREGKCALLVCIKFSYLFENESYPAHL